MLESFSFFSSRFAVELKRSFSTIAKASPDHAHRVPVMLTYNDVFMVCFLF